MTGLHHDGLPCEEFAQTSGNCTRMGQALFDLLTGKNLRLYPSADLRTQALNTISVDSSRGWRISKEKSSRKIDAIVALAMACVGALDEGHTIAAGLTPREMQEVWEQAARDEAEAPRVPVSGDREPMFRRLWNAPRPAGWRRRW
jgi:hypothetical protein